MRFRRRKGRAKVVWLPNAGTKFNQDGVGTPTVNENPSDFEFIVDVGLNPPETVSVPLVLDNPAEVAQVGAPLTTVQLQGLAFNTDWGYKLLRIVGDYYVGIAPTSDQAVRPCGVAVHLGIIVRRVNPNDGTPQSSAEEQDVNTIENNRDPWLWRRTFYLAQGKITANGTNITSEAITTAPPNNVGYGSMKYTHIDQKTKRIVGPEHRLFLDATFWRIPYDEALTGGTIDTNWRAYMTMSYRCLATRVNVMQGNRRNAAR